MSFDWFVICLENEDKKIILTQEDQMHLYKSIREYELKVLDVYIENIKLKKKIKLLKKQ